MKKLIILSLMMFSVNSFAASFPQVDPGLVLGAVEGKSNDNPDDIIFDTHPKYKKCFVKITQVSANRYNVKIIRKGTIFTNTRGFSEEFNNVEFKFRPGANSYYYEGSNGKFTLSLHAVGIYDGRLSVSETHLSSPDESVEWVRWRTCLFNRQ